MTGHHILLVEDDAAISEMFALAFTEGGYLIDVAATVAEAQAALDRSRYALVIVDWRLPDGNGRHIADRAANEGAETILLTGYVHVMPFGQMDRHQIVPKPVRPSELLAIVERRLARTPAD